MVYDAPKTLLPPLLLLYLLSSTLDIKAISLSTGSLYYARYIVHRYYVLFAVDVSGDVS